MGSDLLGDEVNRAQGSKFDSDKKKKLCYLSFECLISLDNKKKMALDFNMNICFTFVRFFLGVLLM